MKYELNFTPSGQLPYAPLEMPTQVLEQQRTSWFQRIMDVMPRGLQRAN